MTLRTVLIALIFLCLAACALAEPLDPHTTVLPSYWLPADAQADGNLAKWKGIPPAVGPDRFKLGESKDLLVPSDEFAPTLYVGRKRDSADMFFLVVVKDRCVMGGESAGWAFGDCLELFVDYGRAARAKENPEWWKDENKWAGAKEMCQFGFLPQSPTVPSKIFRGTNSKDWVMDFASVPVRGGVAYEIRVDGAAAVKKAGQTELPSEIGIDLMMRASDYPIILDGGGWASHRGFYRLFGTWLSVSRPIGYGGVSTAAREPEGEVLPALTLASLYGDAPTLKTLRDALKNKKKYDGNAIAELLYWVANQGQMVDDKLVKQLMASDTPRVREVCLQLMLDKGQDTAARKAAVDLAYKHVATATPLELVCANMLHKELGKDHGSDLLGQLNNPNLMVEFTAAAALAAKGNKDDLAAFTLIVPEKIAVMEKDPKQKTQLAATRVFMAPSLDAMTFRLDPPPVPKAEPLRTVEAKNTDLTRVFAADNNNVYNGAGLLRAWPKEGPKELWRAEIGGGLSPVVEAGGRAFAIGGKDGKATLSCFDAATGTVIWKKVLLEKAPGYLVPSPLIENNERVYVAIDGMVACLKFADGEVIWQDNKAVNGAQFASPIIYGDLLIVPRNVLIAVDKMTGQVRWKTPGPGISPSSPAVQVLDGIPQVVLGVGGGANAEVWGISAKDGAVFWTYPVRGGFGLCTSPVVDGSRVYLSTGEPGCECFTALQMAVKDGKIKAYPALISPDIQGNYANTMDIWDGAIYGWGSGGLECDDQATGSNLWRDKKNWRNDLQLIVADGLLYINNGNELVLAEANKQAYKELGRFRMPVDPSNQQPTIANGRLYVRGNTWIVCYDVKGAAQ